MCLLLSGMLMDSGWGGVFSGWKRGMTADKGREKTLIHSNKMTGGGGRWGNVGWQMFRSRRPVRMIWKEFRTWKVNFDHSTYDSGNPAMSKMFQHPFPLEPHWQWINAFYQKLSCFVLMKAADINLCVSLVLLSVFFLSETHLSARLTTVSFPSARPLQSVAPR